MITLTQLKSFLSINPTAETSKDELLTGFINDAVSELSSLCSRRFDHLIHNEVTDGAGGITLVLDNYPVTNVIKIEVLRGDVWEDLFSAPDTFADSAILLKEVGIIKLIKSYIFPKGERNIKVQYSSGYKFADDWAAGKNYGISDQVRYNNTIYSCIEAHTSGSEFDETKWEADPAKAVPEAIAKAVKHLAAKQFYESPSGKNLFMKSSESFGDKQTVYEDIDIERIIHSLRNTNV